MYIEFEYIVVKNFLSYGNSETKFNFQTGLSLVTAENGLGKSTILLDAISYCLYGKPYRQVKLNELINRKNKKNLYTELSFKIDGKDSYKIVRTLAPQKLFIYKNGSDKALESASSKLLDQEEITKLLGIDYDLFKLIIALAPNTNRPFLSLGLPQKREVMESIFSIKVFGEMLKKARAKLNSIKTDKTIYQSSIKNVESLIITLKKQIDDTENSMKDFDEKKIEEINILQTKKDDIQNQISQINSSLEILIKEFSKISLDEHDYSKEQIEASGNIKIEENTIKEKKSQIKFLEKGGKCPLCSHDITEEHKTEEIQKLNNIITKSETKIETNKKKLVKINEKQSEQRRVKKIYDDSKNDIQIAKIKLSNLEKTSLDLDKQIENVKSRELKIDLTNIKEEYSNKIETYKEDIKKLTTLNNDQKNYEIVSKMLSEDGIKSFFFRMLVPILNNKINEYLNIFDLPVAISFDETMQETISIIGSSDKDVSYNSFSEGEKKRIDIAILLSFISTTKTISNWNCNLLTFDEILDSATDLNGLEKMLSSIKQLTLNDNQLCSYVISHRDSFQDIYSRIIKIKKTNGFSKIEIDK